MCSGYVICIGVKMNELKKAMTAYRRKSQEKKLVRKLCQVIPRIVFLTAVTRFTTMSLHFVCGDVGVNNVEVLSDLFWVSKTGGKHSETVGFEKPGWWVNGCSYASP